MLDINSFDSLIVIVAANAMVAVFFGVLAARHIARGKTAARGDEAAIGIVRPGGDLDRLQPNIR